MSETPKTHFVTDTDVDIYYDDVSECSLSSVASSCDTKPTKFSSVEMGIFLGGCCWMEQGDSINVCFCNAFQWEVPHHTIMKMRSFVEDFSESDVDLLLAHLTAFARQVCSSGAGFELMKLMVRRASFWAVRYFMESGALLDVACMHFGGRLVEYVLHLGRPSLVHMIVQNLFLNESMFSFLSTNRLANYAVQKVVNEMSDWDLEMCLGIVVDCAVDLSTDMHGAFVLQKILKRASRMMEMSKKESGGVAAHVGRILSKLIGMGNRLIVDRYGNFSAQEMIDVLPLFPLLATQFARVLSGNLVGFSADEFGHSVVEKFLKRRDLPGNTLLVEKFLSLDEFDIGVCVDNQWGKFVVQKLWARATPPLRQEMYQNLMNAGKERIARFVTI